MKILTRDNVRLLCLSLLILTNIHVQAKAEKPPIEISAENTLEWDRKQKIFTANGHAQAKQGEVSVKADLLKATYRDSQTRNIDIRQIDATGNVILTSKDTHAYGNYATYNLDTQLAIITGDNLRMEAPKQKITAQDRFEYWTAQNKITAIGNPVITQINEKGETNTLKADQFTATLKENAAGKTIFHTLEAKGHVIITTPAETLTGTYGLYNADTNTAEIKGGVKLTRGPNILEGEKAHVDLNTNVSRIIGSGTPAGRVRGVFYPGDKNSAKKETKKTTDTPSTTRTGEQTQ